MVAGFVDYQDTVIWNIGKNLLTESKNVFNSFSYRALISYQTYMKTNTIRPLLVLSAVLGRRRL